MKKLVSFIMFPFLLLGVLACNSDDDVDPKKEVLLRKVKYKGALYKEYIYGLDKKLVQINTYTSGQGQTTKSSYGLLNYNADGLLEEYLWFNKANEAYLRYTYKYNASGQITRREVYSTTTGDKDLVTMEYYTVYEYNSAGQAIKETYRDPDNSISWYKQYTYDENGNIQSSTAFDDDVETSNWQITNEKTFEHENIAMPSHLKNYLIHPLDNDFYLFTLVEENSTSTYSNGSQYKYTLSISGKMYNDDGHLTEYVYTLRQIAIDGTESTSNATYSFEYTVGV